jgi:hypothetical protein
MGGEVDLIGASPNTLRVHYLHIAASARDDAVRANAERRAKKAELGVRTAIASHPAGDPSVHRRLE